MKDGKFSTTKELKDPRDMSRSAQNFRNNLPCPFVRNIWRFAE